MLENLHINFHIFHIFRKINVNCIFNQLTIKFLDIDFEYVVVDVVFKMSYCKTITTIFFNNIM